MRADRIIALRKQLRLNQSSLARKMTAQGEYTAPSHISALERGQKGLGSTKLAALALALETNANYLLGLTDDPAATTDLARQASIPIANDDTRPMVQQILNLLASLPAAELLWLTQLLDKLYAANKTVVQPGKRRTTSTGRVEPRIEELIRSLVDETTFTKLMEFLGLALNTGNTDPLIQAAYSAFVLRRHTGAGSHMIVDFTDVPQQLRATERPNASRHK